MRSLPIEEIERLSPEAFRESPKHPFVLVLDSIRSRNNVGSIFRTMDAFAGEKLYLCGFTPAPPHRDIHKTALGAEEVVAWEQRESVGQTLEQLQRQGYRIIALEHTDESQTLTHFSFSDAERYAFVLGNEVKGVSAEALAYCQAALEIPQFGTKHSLNVGVSAGVLLWHIVSQLR